jgi:hypothetical protein
VLTNKLEWFIFINIRRYKMVNEKAKARVFEIGNKIAAETGDRPGAFREAWAMVKGSGLDVRVAGVSFGRRPVALERLTRYPRQAIKAVAVAEPGNTYDPHAVAVLVGVNGGRGLYKIGYVPAPMTAAVHAMRTLPTVEVTGDTVRGIRLHFAV